MKIIYGEKEVECSNIQLSDIIYKKSLLTPIQQEIIDLYESNEDQFIIKTIYNTVDYGICQKVDITIDNSQEKNYCNIGENMSYACFYKYLTQIDLDKTDYSRSTFDIYCKEHEVKNDSHKGIEAINKFLLDIVAKKEVPLDYGYGKFFDNSTKWITRGVLNVTSISLAPKGKIILTDCTDEIDGCTRDEFVYTNNSRDVITLNVL